MIDSRKVRLGNYVCIYNGKTERVEEANRLEFGSINDMDIKYINPIDLDVIWLDNFGFVKNGDWWDKGTLGINLIEGRCTKKLEREDYGQQYKDLPLPKYVHHLQNLYYALFGEDLETKE